MKALLAVLVVLMFVSVTPVKAEPAQPDEPIPAEDEVPWGDYQIDKVYLDKNPVRAEACYPSRDNCQYRVLLQCMETNDPNPKVGQWYRREGSRKWFPINFDGQILYWLETLSKPLYRHYLPVIWWRQCTCECACWCW